MRVAVAGSSAPSLSLSANLAKDSQGRDSCRREVKTNLLMVQHIFFFVFSGVVKSYGVEILPPKFRTSYQNPCFTAPTAPAPSLFGTSFLELLGLGYLLRRRRHWGWEMLLGIFGASLLTYAGEFILGNISGTFKRPENRQVVY
jgi:hypothetical protein